LQTLFHTRLFRKVVYEVPLKPDELVGAQNTVKSLQQVFYDLEVSPDSVSTKHLTQSFGWTAIDSFQQHDVQELLRVLTDHLETKLKGGVMEKCIAQLLQGKTVTTISCVRVPYSSRRVEDFFDIQLPVKDCPNIMESFKRYVAEEKLTGDNQYSTEQYGKQDAICSVKFGRLPPVLHLQLKRFEFSLTTYTMEKINSRFEFPETMDLSEFVDESLVPEPDSAAGEFTPSAAVDATPSALATARAVEHASKAPDHVYCLHSVLVHSGGVGGGHYYAFVRPQLAEIVAESSDSGAAAEDGDDVRGCHSRIAVWRTMID
jgi:ubiquitin carboxyl-terminal hydrolase 7